MICSPESESVLVVIPARGGSRRIPRKNIKKFCGKPLVAWTIEAAQGSQFVNKIFVSTDDLEIAGLCQSYGIPSPKLRDPSLAKDDVHAVKVVLNYLDSLQVNSEELPSIVLMLLPTSPLRTSADIDGAIGLLMDSGADSVIGVTEHSKPLVSLRWIREKKLESVIPITNIHAQHQDFETLYAVNGAMFAARSASLRFHETYHMPDAIPFVMNQRSSVDINYEEDFRFAEYLYEDGIET
tara:strand:+ start:9404 stop:10120 length:717 start_codon:yes stop_codon:yes gene_type:complete